MHSRIWLFALVLGCALFVVRATEEEQPVEEQSLDARYGGRNRGDDSSDNNRGWKRGRGGRGDSSDDDSSDNNKGRGGRGGRGDSSDDSSDNGRGRGRGGGRNLNALAGSGLRNKVINLGTRYLGTRRSYSGGRKVVASRKDNYFHKNFANTVTSNLNTLRKHIHTDTRILVKKPLTVDNLKVHQHTNYVKRIFPHLQKLWVQRYGQVIAPSRLTQVSRSASAASRTYRHRLQVSSRRRSYNLGTKYAGVRDLGVNNLGYTGNRGRFNNRDSSNSSNNGRGRGGGRGRGRGNDSSDNKGCYGSYC